VIEDLQLDRFAAVKDVGAVVVKTEYRLDQEKTAPGTEKTAIFSAFLLLGYPDAQEQVDQHLEAVGIIGHVRAAAAASGPGGAAAAE
jgi:hypothetical protein